MSTVIFSCTTLLEYVQQAQNICDTDFPIIELNRHGKAVPITWKRASANDITHYYTQDGQEIILNPGKTWVEIVENSRASQNKISAE